MDNLKLILIDIIQVYVDKEYETCARLLRKLSEYITIDNIIINTPERADEVNIVDTIEGIDLNQYITDEQLEEYQAFATRYNRSLNYDVRLFDEIFNAFVNNNVKPYNTYNFSSLPSDTNSTAIIGDTPIIDTTGYVSNEPKVQYVKPLVLAHVMLDIFSFVLTVIIIVVLLVEFEGKIKSWLSKKTVEVKTTFTKPKPRLHTSYFPLV